MRIVKLSDGRLLIPMSGAGDDWAADGVETIGPDDPRYAGYLPLALMAEEHAAHEREAEPANAQLLARWETRYEAQHGRRTA